MAERLALDLTQSHACLLAFCDGDWRRVGATDLDGAELRERLSALLARGIALTGGSRPPLLVSLPADQMTYASLPAPPEDADRLATLRGEMIRQFPHLEPAPHLDWCAHGPWYQVAATPQSVLEEVTAFLTACGLPPAAFTARPALAEFAGQPDLGALTAAETRIADWPALPEDPAAVTPAIPARLTAAAAKSNARISSAREKAARAASTDPERLIPLDDPDPEAAARPPRRSRLVLALLQRLVPGPKAQWLSGATAALALALLAVALWPGAPKQDLNAERPSLSAEGPGEEQDPPAAAPAPTRIAKPQLLAAPPDDEAEADLAEDAGLTVAMEETAAPAALPLPEDMTVFFNPPPHLGQSPDAASLDALLQPGIDPSFRTDALALPETALWDEASLPHAPQAPGPATQTYVVDARGLVSPSADGTRNQDGVMVFAGAPPRLSEPRPGRDPDAVTLTVLSLAALDEDNPLRGAMPRARPDGLAERFERAKLGGKTAAELQLFRPRPRPASQQQLAVASAPAIAQAVQQVLSDTPRPVARSPQAAQRFAQARAARPATPVRSADTLVPARASPEKVARQATASSGLDLSELNLLGTFGSRARPRALVRLPSGRVVNVAVGDRMDGGRVSEITQGRLRYVKSGQNISLSMPRG